MRRTHDWMRQADGELKVSGDLFSTENFAWCCFACHQVAEKSLKAVSEHLLSPRIGHDLLDLMNSISQKLRVPSKIKEACVRLNKFYISTRYPNAFVAGAPVDKFSSEEARKAIKDAQAVFNFAKRITKFA